MKYDSFIAFKAPSSLAARLRAAAGPGKVSDFIRKAVADAVAPAEREQPK